MATYAAIGNVTARVAGRTIDTGSAPTQVQVEAWIDEGEALVTGELLAAQCALPAASALGGKILTSWVTDYAEAHVRMAWVAAIGGGSDDGKDLLERFNARLDDIANNPARYSAMLNGGAADDSARSMRSHVLDNTDDKTVADGDFDPIFEIDNTDPSSIF